MYNIGSSVSVPGRPSWIRLCLVSKMRRHKLVTAFCSCSLLKNMWLYWIWLLNLNISIWGIPYSVLVCLRFLSTSFLSFKIKLTVSQRNSKWHRNIWYLSRTLIFRKPFVFGPRSYHCTMIPLLTRSCLKSSKLRPILNGQFSYATSKNICLNLLGSKQPWEILVFVIFKL